MLCVVLGAVHSSANGNLSYCTRILKILSVKHRALGSIEELKIGTYNVLDFGPQKSAEHIQSIANIIKESNPDIMVLEEVQGYQMLSDFVHTHLNDDYDVLMTSIDSPNSIQNGFLVKKDLPFMLELDSHFNEMWQDPTRTDGVAQKLFPRDLPVLKVSSPAQDPAQGKPLLLVAGVHLKSKRDRVGDLESRILRKAQADRVSQIVQNYEERYHADIPTMVMGDFNGSVNLEPEYTALKTLTKMQDALSLEAVTPVDADRVTHTFFAHGGVVEQNQLDYVLLSPDLKDALIEGEVYRYKDSLGQVKDLPQTKADRDHNPSDHFPYFVRLKFSKIVAGVIDRKPDRVSARHPRGLRAVPRDLFKVKYLSPHL